MPLWLRERAGDLLEYMDDPQGSPERLANTLNQFRHINRHLSGWRRLFQTYIRPHCTDSNRTYTLLDIGFGGGDIPRDILQWSRDAGIRLQIEAIDTDPRALAFVEQMNWPGHIHFQCIHHAELLKAGKTYDFVISNHLLHHLPPKEVTALLLDISRMTKITAVFSDLTRSDMAYGLFWCGTLGRFRNSYIRADGLRSICRSYTVSELRALAPSGWQILPAFPFRLLALYQAESLP